ncbi:hypothetical protein [Arcanobacterium phocae]|uniref:hypothetical protein n=2 Tax=Arcanobacterium phocae TaxID=131112 RepID=UPI001C0FF68D|nr:hypothetical protein [Arcanobacterium phocae]
MMSKTHGRRVVRLSRVDAQRLERGEIEYAEQALHISDAGPVLSRKSAIEPPKPVNLSPHERELIENIPPHFGKI